MPSQTEIVNLEHLIKDSHPYRLYKNLLDFDLVCKELSDVSSWCGPKGAVA